MVKILIVDDEPVFLTSMGLVLRQEGFEVRTAGDAEEAAAAAAGWGPDVLLADWMLGDGKDGIELAESLRARHPGLRLILMTGYASPEVRRRLEESSGGRLLAKPFSPEHLISAIHEASG